MKHETNIHAARKAAAIILLAISLLILPACVPHSRFNHEYVSRMIAKRTGHALPPVAPLSPGDLPPGISLADGLSENEAVAIALWRNAQFRVDLADLTFARAELAEAGLLPNPLLSFLRLFGIKGNEYYVLWPLEALWQRGKRVSAAKRNAERVADNLVQLGLKLARDTLLAYADLNLAEERSLLCREDSRVRGEIAALTAIRFKTGEISGFEESAARLDALRAEATDRLASRDAQAARARLTARLGFDEPVPTFILTPALLPLEDARPLAELLAASFAWRPDLRAAQIEIETAGARLGWERSKILKLTVTMDAKEKGDSGIFTGPSAKMELPFFNRNEAGKTRARAELERAVAKFAAVRQAIAAEVREASAAVEAARRTSALLKNEVEAAAAASEQSKKAYIAGEKSYLFALEARHREIDARLRAAEARADLLRSEATLRCATGFSPAGEAR